MIRKVFDRNTGLFFTPGMPMVCPGNGIYDHECCCDECDHLTLCLPEFEPKNTDGMSDTPLTPQALFKLWRKF